MMNSLRKWREKLLGQGDLDSPIVVWGIVIVAVIVVKSVVLDPFLDWRSGQYKSLEQLESRTGKIIAMQAVEREWEKRSTEFERVSEGLDDYVLRGVTDANRQSEMQKHIKALVGRGAMKMNQLVFLDKSEVFGSYASTSLRFKVTGSVEDQLTFVRDLASSTTLLALASWQFVERGKNSSALIEVRGYYIKAAQQ